MLTVNVAVLNQDQVSQYVELSLVDSSFVFLADSLPTVALSIFYSSIFDRSMLYLAVNPVGLIALLKKKWLSK